MKQNQEQPTWLSSEDLAVLAAFRRINGIPDPQPAVTPVCA